jgi:hypothetical protein
MPHRPPRARACPAARIGVAVQGLPQEQDRLRVRRQSLDLLSPRVREKRDGAVCRRERKGVIAVTGVDVYILKADGRAQ